MQPIRYQQVLFSFSFYYTSCEYRESKKKAWEFPKNGTFWFRLNVVVGMCSGQTTISVAAGVPALLVEDVIAQKEYCRQGIGRRLMKEIAEWGKTKGALRHQLLADRNNTSALEFYIRLGWQTTDLICLRKQKA